MILWMCALKLFTSLFSCSSYFSLWSTSVGSNCNQTIDTIVDGTSSSSAVPSSNSQSSGAAAGRSCSTSSYADTVRHGGPQRAASPNTCLNSVLQQADANVSNSARILQGLPSFKLKLPIYLHTYISISFWLHVIFSIYFCFLASLKTLG